MPEVTLVSLSEYARMRGCAKSAVHKAVKEGRISTIDGKIDPAVADIQWQRNTRARVDSSPAEDRAPGAVFPPVSAGAGGFGGGDDPGDYMVHRTRKEAAQASMAELDLAEMQKRLIDAKRARAATITAYRLLRDAMQTLGRKIGPKLASVDDARAAQALVDDEIRAMLSTFRSRTLPALQVDLGAGDGHASLRLEAGE